MFYTLSDGTCESCEIDYELREQEPIIQYRVCSLYGYGIHLAPTDYPTGQTNELQL